MAQLQAIKRRIRTVKNTRQITKAMELVAASKMRRAQEATLKTRIYSNTAREILARLQQLKEVKAHALYAKRPVKTKLYVVITSDRGLAGAYNSNVLKSFSKAALADIEAGVTVKALTVGKLASRFAAGLEGVEPVGAYEQWSIAPAAEDIRPIYASLVSQFQDKTVDAVDVIFTDFRSAVVQTTKTTQLLPAFVDTAGIEVGEDLRDSEFEPSPQAVLETIVPRLVEAQLYQFFLESSASEQAARMMAMKNASDNANDLVDRLTLEFNSARQASITQELAEITGGAEAISA